MFLSKAPRDPAYLHKEARMVPAPGEYEVANPFHNKKGHTFAGAGRFVVEKTIGPHYDMPSSIGIIQHYHKRN